MDTFESILLIVYYLDILKDHLEQRYSIFSKYVNVVWISGVLGVNNFCLSDHNCLIFTFF